MRSWAYNGFGVLMGTSWRASCPRWPSLRTGSLPMITLFNSQGDLCATACASSRLLTLSCRYGMLIGSDCYNKRLRDATEANTVGLVRNGSNESYCPFPV